MASSNDNGRLIATAVGAAAAGAALAVAAMTLMDHQSKEKQAYSMPLQNRPKRSSYILNGPSHDSSGKADITLDESQALLFPHNHEEKMRRRIASRVSIEEENSMPRESVTVRVPATSANVGPGCT